MQEITRLLAEEIDGFYREIRELTVTPKASSAEIRQHLERSFDLKRGQALEEVFPAVTEVLRRWTVHTVHPRHFGLFPPSVTPASVVGDALASLYNPQVGAWWLAPAANEIEQLTLRFFLDRLGMTSPSRFACFTTGGSEANTSAVLVALTRAFPGFAQGGARAIDGQPRFYLSEAAHDSFVKIAHSSGIGRSALRRVRVDGDLRMDVAHLESLVEADRRAGDRPFLVVGTAGTTTAGTVDPLETLAGFAREQGLWFHADAAWAGAATLSRRLRPHLAGVSYADSITFDAHKWLSVPVAAGMFFCRDREAVARTFGVVASYIPENTDGTIDLYQHSIQWTRRCMGLKVFMLLASLGEEGLEKQIDHQAEMGDRLRELLFAKGWLLRNRTPFPLLCFTHPRIVAGELTARALVKRVLDRGRAWLSEARYGEEPVLRACITSYRTTPEDLDVLVEELQSALLASGVENI